MKNISSKKEMLNIRLAIYHRATLTKAGGRVYRLRERNGRNDEIVIKVIPSGSADTARSASALTKTLFVKLLSQLFNS